MKPTNEPAWFINLGGGKLEPIEGPTAAETPAAKHDVEALLEEAAKHTTGAKAPWSAAGVIEHIAVALRAERERANTWAQLAQEKSALAVNARHHLRAVLDFMWPGDMGGPTVVQKARAFLAGDGQEVVRAGEDLERALEDAEVARDAYRRKHLDAVARVSDLSKECELLRRELAEKGAALVRMIERIDQLDREADRYAKMADARMVQFTNERDAHDKTRAQLAAEDEAHAHTKARLVEIERYVDENVQARQNAQFRAADLEIRLAEALKGQTRASDELAKSAAEQTRLQDELDKARIERVASARRMGAAVAEVQREQTAEAQRAARLASDVAAAQAETREALAAQNRAESEAAELRAQLADLETAIRAIVDRVEKGRA